MAPGTPALSSNQLLSGLCAILGLALLLCGLCALCKKRTKRRRRGRDACPGSMAIVDVRLLRQTQLRSLSKSDTKLHEIKRPPLGDPQLRPVSMDPIYHSPNWHLHEDNATYSNLNYSPAPLKSNLYKKSAGPRGEPLNGTSESQGSEVNAEYAVVSKGRKRANPGAQERREVQAGPAEGPGLPHRPDDLEIEAMYSKVNKKKARHVESIPNVASEWAPPSLQLEENFYESICEMSSRAL